MYDSIGLPDGVKNDAAISATDSDDPSKGSHSAPDHSESVSSTRELYSLRRVARYVYPPLSHSPLPISLAVLCLFIDSSRGGKTWLPMSRPFCGRSRVRPWKRASQSIAP